MQRAEAMGNSERGAMRAAFLAFVVLAAVIWVGIAIGANARTPGAVGLAATVFGGLFASILTVAIGGGIALKLGAAEATRPAEQRAIDTPYPELTPALAELEAQQPPIARRLRERAAWRAPLGASAGVTVWSGLVTLGAPGGVLDFGAVILGGGLAGYGWALAQAARESANIYSQRVVDVLAGGLGALNWRDGVKVDLAGLQVAGLLPAASGVKTGGEIAGAHAGLSLRITPVETIPLAGADKSAAFKGLLVEIEAPHLAGASLDALAVARPTVPALIEQLSTLPHLGKAASAISDGRLLLAIPEIGDPRVFAPPAQPGARDAATPLARLRQVIGAVLHVAEALAAPATP